ncbi:MAG: hypothetical protein ABIQ12_15520 [Opitutaceae bacterium]
MKLPVLAVLLALCAGCAQQPEVIVVYPNKIEATVAARKASVRDQKKKDQSRFNAEYGSVLGAKRIEAKEAMQLGYLFFYSSGSLCGYLDNPRLIDGVWQIDFFPGLPPSIGDPVFVDARTGEIWQTTQKKVDALALLRYE